MGSECVSGVLKGIDGTHNLGKGQTVIGSDVELLFPIQDGIGEDDILHHPLLQSWCRWSFSRWVSPG